jgi:hypothetical protein
VFDLANGTDPARGIAANAVAAALVAVLLGLDILSNPEAHVESRGEALRAVLFFTGCIWRPPVLWCSLWECSVDRSPASAWQELPPVARCWFSRF